MEKAQIVAIYGRVLEQNETSLQRYYAAVDELEAGMNRKVLEPMFSSKGIELPYSLPPEKIQALKDAVAKEREAICSVFMQAVDTHNGQAIMDLARAVWFFKDKRHPQPPKDQERVKLLFLKTALDNTPNQPPLTIRQIARLMAWETLSAGGKFESSPDGFSKLRRKCKQLGIPVAQSRKHKRK